jgi:[acyl-carrier-protein] S-malonyltransferase
MQEAVPQGKGGMAAILGLTGEVVQEVIGKISGASVANYNCPGQIVISGEIKAVEEACVKLKEAGAKRTVMLNVSGPFHSQMLKGAGDKLGQVLEQAQIKEHTIPYVSNVTASCITGTQEIQELLKKQVSSSVLWEQSVKTMIQDKVDCFVEIGPGRTLTSFIKKISREVSVYNVATWDDLEKLGSI